MNHRPTRLITALFATTGLVVSAAACSDDPNAATPVPESTVSAVAEPAANGTETTEAPPATVDMTPYVGPVGDLVGEALTHHVFTTLAGYVLEANLLDVLRSEGPFTVFAPTNDAFNKIPVDTLRSVQSDIPLLTTVLTYHVLPGKLMAADLEPGTYDTAAGIPVEITRDGDTVFVNGFELIVTDVEATNGVIHVLGDVLIPDA